MSEDINAEVIKKTQKVLGKYVKKPPLTEKLLRKPPFRFLHDVINVVINETGFLKGVFSEEELKTENVKEKDAKIAFLNKLIDAVKFVTKTDLAVRSGKIVAGLEPTKTNLLLQAIGKAIEAKLDVSEYVAQLNSGNTDTTEKKKLKKDDDKIKSNSKTKVVKDETKVTKSKKTIGDSPRSKVKDSTPKESSRSKTKVDKSIKKEVKSKSKVKEEQKETNDSTVKKAVPEAITPKEVKGNASNTNDIPANAINSELNNEIKNIISTEEKIEAPESLKEITKSESVDKEEKTETVENNQSENVLIENSQTENPQVVEGKTSAQSLKRPKSARPKSGERRMVSSKQRTPAVHQDEVLRPLEMTMTQPARPKSSLRPPSVRPSSARPGAPRLRPDSALPLQEAIPMGNINVIIENMDNVDDEETVVIQTAAELSEENASNVEVPQDNKGQLVEQILEQIQEEDGVKKKVDIDWEQDALHNKDGTSKEINNLRSLIQTLTKTANPLGKLLNYLHEDIDAMHAELQMWTNIKKQLLSEIQKQKRLNSDLNKPLLTHLDHLKEEIKRQDQEIINVRSNILRNELRIKELLM